MDGINQHYYVWGLGFQGDSTTYTMLKVSQDQFDRLKKLNAEIAKTEAERDVELKKARGLKEIFFGVKPLRELEIIGKYKDKLNSMHLERLNVVLENKLDAPGIMLNFKGRNGVFKMGEAVTIDQIREKELRLLPSPALKQ